MIEGLVGRTVEMVKVVGMAGVNGHAHAGGYPQHMLLVLNHFSQTAYQACGEFLRLSRGIWPAEQYGKFIAAQVGEGVFVARVSMDLITVDVSGLPDVAVGTPVELWGAQLPVDEVADYAGTLSYELLSQVTARVPRRY